MRNKVLTALALFLLAGRGLMASWRTDVAAYFGLGSYREASEFLLRTYPDLDTLDKPEASALLAFLFRKQDDKALERRWLFEFFEAQGDGNTDFIYLGISADSQVTAFLNDWRMRFPRLTGVFLITRQDDHFLSAPSSLTLGLDSPLEIFYKLSDENGPQQGGLLHTGLNLISLDSSRLFDASGTHVYTLDLKSGDIQVRKELAIDVRLSAEPASAGGPQPMDLEYKLTMFVGGRQIASSRKTGRDKEPLALDIPPVNMVANPMFKPPNPDDPFDPANRGVSILDAINVAYGLLKDLFKSKERPYQSPLEKKTSVTYSYFQATAQGGVNTRISAVVSLSARQSRLMENSPPAKN
jgi:hypothetical protein